MHCHRKVTCGNTVFRCAGHSVSGSNQEQSEGVAIAYPPCHAAVVMTPITYAYKVKFPRDKSITFLCIDDMFTRASLASEYRLSSQQD